MRFIEEINGTKLEFRNFKCFSFTKFTSFNNAIIPTVKESYPQAPHWLANFFLNSALRGKYEASMQQLVLGYLRRAYHGFIAYHSARESTLEYLDNNDPHQANIREYYEAIALWENYVLQIANKKIKLTV